MRSGHWSKVPRRTLRRRDGHTSGFLPPFRKTSAARSAQVRCLAARYCATDRRSSRLWDRSRCRQGTAQAVSSLLSARSDAGLHAAWRNLAKTWLRRARSMPHVDSYGIGLPFGHSARAKAVELVLSIAIQRCELPLQSGLVLLGKSSAVPFDARIAAQQVLLYNTGKWLPGLGKRGDGDGCQLIPNSQGAVARVAFANRVGPARGS